MKTIKSVSFNHNHNKLYLHFEDARFEGLIYSILKALFRVSTALFLVILIIFFFSENKTDSDYFYLVFVYTSFVGMLQLIKTILAGPKFLPVVKYDFIFLLFLIFLILSVITKQYLGYIDSEYLSIGEYWHSGIWGFLLLGLFTYLLIVNFGELTRRCYILELEILLVIPFYVLRFVFGLGLTNDMLILFVVLLPVLIDKIASYYFREPKDKKNVMYYVLSFSALAFIILFIKVQIYDLSSIGLLNDLKTLLARQLSIKEVIWGMEFTYRYNSFVSNFFVNFGIVNFIFLISFIVLIVKDIKANLFSKNLRNRSLMISLLLFILTVLLFNPGVEIFIFLALLYALLYGEMYLYEPPKWKLLMLKMFKKRMLMFRLIQLLGTIVFIIFTIFVNLNVDRIFYIV